MRKKNIEYRREFQLNSFITFCNYYLINFNYKNKKLAVSPFDGDIQPQISILLYILITSIEIKEGTHSVH